MVAPKLRFKEFDGDWTESKLKDCIDSIDSGWSPQCESHPADENEWAVLKTTSVDWDGFKANFNKKLPSNLEARFEIEVKPNDILVTRAGPTERVGVVAVVPHNVRSRLMISDKLIRLKANNENNPEFLGISLSSVKCQNQLQSKTSGLAKSQTNISQKILSDVSLITPSKPEQTKIASFLSAVDQKISQLTQKHELLSQYKQGMMQKLFSQQIRFKADDGSEFGEWEKRKVSDLFIEIKEKVLNQNIETYSITAGKGFVSQAEKFGRNISGMQNSNYIVLQPNDFSYNKGNSKTFKYGCVYLNEFDHPIAVPNVFISFRAKVTKSIYEKFYAHLFENHYLDRRLRLLISSSARMDGLLNVSKEGFFEIKLPSPCLEEQTEIANFLSAIDQKIEIVAQQIEQAKQWKKGLLQQMFV